MREGQNPMKWRQDEYRPQRVTVATMVHIPERSGYWSESLEVLDLCLSSLRQNTGLPFELMVVDNRSCEEVRNHLVALNRDGTIDSLILSRHNLRKLGAVKLLLGASAGEIVSLTDSDVYFAPGWLEATLEVLAAFPEAGQVTALPTADKTGSFCEATLSAAKADPSITIDVGDDLIPERHLRAHAESLGVSWEEYLERTAGRPQVRLTRNGVSAFVSAQDFQYTTTRAALTRVLPLGDPGDNYFDAVYSPVFEAAVDAAGLWRLSTEGYFAHHMGNRMPREEDLHALLGAGTIHGRERTPSPAISGATSARPTGRIRTNRFIRRVLKAVNTWTYRLLFEERRRR